LALLLRGLEVLSSIPSLEVGYPEDLLFFFSHSEIILVLYLKIVHSNVLDFITFLFDGAVE
jgi:hypothetical protein